jgi:hypothetical protein
VADADGAGTADVYPFGTPDGGGADPLGSGVADGTDPLGLAPGPPLGLAPGPPLGLAPAPGLHGGGGGQGLAVPDGPAGPGRTARRTPMQTPTPTAESTRTPARTPAPTRKAARSGRTDFDDPYPRLPDGVLPPLGDLFECCGFHRQTRWPVPVTRTVTDLRFLGLVTATTVPPPNLDDVAVNSALLSVS